LKIEIRELRSGDEALLQHVAFDVFDNAVDDALAAEFLQDDRNRLVVALDGNVVVGFASGVIYIHPDKPRELWINEIGVAPTHQGRGIGKQVIDALLQSARDAGCREAWVLTDHDNAIARRLYESAGGIADERTVMYSFRFL
jgi:aminoglycoside 6'-N-acetyltransferase I